MPWDFLLLFSFFETLAIYDFIRYAYSRTQISRRAVEEDLADAVSNLEITLEPGNRIRKSLESSMDPLVAASFYNAR